MSLFFRDYGYLNASIAAQTFQPQDPDLTSIAALGGTGFLKKTAPDTWTLDPTAYGTGTVSSVGLIAPTGFAVTGSPVTGSGDLNLGFAAGYALPTTAKQSDWDTAFGWGNHAASGYLDGSAIGSTVLAYDANLQGFASAFTLPTADGTSGQVLTTNGAGVISFATPSGGGSPTSPEIITTPSGTVYRLTQNTAPTERGPGLPLVEGDFWCKPTDNGIPGTAGEWLWTGLYWVSADTYSVMGGLAFSNGNISVSPFSAIQHSYTLPTNPNGSFNPNIYIVGCSISYKVAATVDANNYWWPAVLACRFQSISSSTAGGEAVHRINGLAGDTDATLRTTVSGTKTDIYKAVNAPISFGSVPIDFFPTVQIYAYKVGSPGNLQGLAVNLITRKLHR